MLKRFLSQQSLYHKVETTDDSDTLQSLTDKYQDFVANQHQPNKTKLIQAVIRAGLDAEKSAYFELAIKFHTLALSIGSEDVDIIFGINSKLTQLYSNYQPFNIPKLELYANACLEILDNKLLSNQYNPKDLELKLTRTLLTTFKLSQDWLLAGKYANKLYTLSPNFHTQLECAQTAVMTQKYQEASLLFYDMFFLMQPKTHYAVYLCYYIWCQFLVDNVANLTQKWPRFRYLGHQASLTEALISYVDQGKSRNDVVLASLKHFLSQKELGLIDYALANKLQGKLMRD